MEMVTLLKTLAYLVNAIILLGVLALVFIVLWKLVVFLNLKIASIRSSRQ